MNEFIELAHYLKDPDVLRRTDCTKPFLLPNYKMIKRLVEATFNRLYPSEDVETQTEERGEDDILPSSAVINKSNDQCFSDTSLKWPSIVRNLTSFQY